MIKFHYGKHERDINKTLNKLVDQNIISRIWKKDYTVWGDDPNEIINRLGWLDSPEDSINSLKEIDGFIESVLKDGFTHALLLGMGGSSLAPEVFRLTFGVKKGYLDLAVLDSTDPGSVKFFADNLPLKKTLFIVSTKSGGTVETFSFMKFFYNLIADQIGKNKAGSHFIAITDPGSGLQKVAENLKFRKIFLNDPNIGGRFSVLSLFGCIPAALVGVKLDEFLMRAHLAVLESKKTGPENTAAVLGCFIGELAEQGVDKLTLIMSEQIRSFGAWVEQLVAESTGKMGKGILPVDGEEILSPESYSNDRVFISLRLADDNSNLDKIDLLRKNGFPVIEIAWNSLYDLAVEFYRWEFATAVAGWRMQIQPFDQPNVEEAKVVARKFVQEYMESGKLPELVPSLVEEEIKVFGETSGSDLHAIMKSFLSECIPGKSYVSIQAYLRHEKLTDQILQLLRTEIQKEYKVPVTVGYGPRFLHSTGQLHKGDNGNGLFIQLLADMPEDLPIPDDPGSEQSSISFGVLKTAQAFGDRQALLDNKRKVLTVHLGNEIAGGIKRLII